MEYGVVAIVVGLESLGPVMSCVSVVFWKRRKKGGSGSFIRSFASSLIVEVNTISPIPSYFRFGKKKS